MARSGRLAILYVAWVPFRGDFLDRDFPCNGFFAPEPDRTLHVMNHFFSPWVLLGLLIVPVLLAFKFISVEKTPDEHEPNEKAIAKSKKGAGTEKATSVDAAQPYFAFSNNKHAYPTGVLLLAMAACCFTFAVSWIPMGGRNAGRVLVVEKHSTWEPTTTPYSTTKYGELSSYTYTAIYHYLSQYFSMGRIEEEGKIDAETLEKCDVLIVKTPTARYTPAEIEAVLHFVQNGGGILFVGDHTNLYGMATSMNDISRAIGFTYPRRPPLFKRTVDL